ncbi:hypothetical protein [Ferrimonas marina]|uniref:Uncharacterized protein n=1 Tax=Ferrimonas marina TaxID=299255 RepID=A0A1M5YDK4_9GAMM|nr:hypothetical protein [Ferrimonas marina]SHI10032.1 hypothetical protein SAMN02745129_4110 [Ferrimonas marina]
MKLIEKGRVVQKTGLMLAGLALLLSGCSSTEAEQAGTVLPESDYYLDLRDNEQYT